MYTWACCEGYFKFRVYSSAAVTFPVGRICARSHLDSRSTFIGIHLYYIHTVNVLNLTPTKVKTRLTAKIDKVYCDVIAIATLYGKSEQPIPIARISKGSLSRWTFAKVYAERFLKKIKLYNIYVYTS